MSHADSFLTNASALDPLFCTTSKSTRHQQADLEDKILKKNIPGKYTWWDKDSDEEGEGARADWVDREASDPETEMTEMEKQKKWVENDCPEPIRRTIMAREEKERARTGVKGVLADYDAWKLSADAGTRSSNLLLWSAMQTACAPNQPDLVN